MHDLQFDTVNGTLSSIAGSAAGGASAAAPASSSRHADRVVASSRSGNGHRR